MFRKSSKMNRKKSAYKYKKANINKVISYEEYMDGLTGIESFALREKFFSTEKYKEVQLDAVLISNIEHKESENESGTVLVVQMAKKINKEEVELIKSQITDGYMIDCSFVLIPFQNKLDELVKGKLGIVKILEEKYEWFI